MKKYKNLIYSILEMVLVVVVTITVFKYVIVPIRIQGVSMENTLHDNSIALINAFGLKEESIDRFDIVVLNSDELNEKIIKRVIGLPGDKVEMKDDVLYINGELVEQDFLDKDFVEQSKINQNAVNFTDNFSVEVPEHEFFVLGDNRLRSTDSRVLGTFTIDDVVGVQGVVIFPFDDMKWMK